MTAAIHSKRRSKLTVLHDLTPWNVKFQSDISFDAVQLAISQYPESPVTGHLDTGIS
jgi:hypothetical protein